MATHNPPVADAAASLTIAILMTSNAPIVLLDKELNIVVASRSFCSAFGLDPTRVTGTQFGELGNGEWNVPQLISGLISATSGNSVIDGYELTLSGEDGSKKHLVLEAHRLEYGHEQDIRVILSVVDVTEAKHGDRLKEKLMQERAVLLQELHHRVFNSLQLISSVLLQSAMITRSDEAKRHLNDAHNRIMSVANLQRHLAQTSSNHVELRLYLNDLCRSIGASMIWDRACTSIEVTCDNSATSSEFSISLGLIVTELVINGLKHAFPDNQKGRIIVDYRSIGAEWTLTVRDDGIGMPAAGEASKPGLGTSIIEALARQLEAAIHVHDGKPGTEIEISHHDVADVAKIPRLLRAV